MNKKKLMFFFCDLMQRPMRNRFLSLHVLALFVHAACAIYAFASSAAPDTPIPAHLDIVSYEAPTNSVYYDVERRVAFDVPSVITLHGIVAVVTFAFHALVYVPAHYLFAERIWKQGFFPVRWVEYSVTCTLMSIASVSSAGNSDFTSVLAVAVLGPVLQSLGCFIEQDKSARFLFASGFLLNVGISVSSAWYILSAPTTSYLQIIEFLAYGFYYGLFPLNAYMDTLRSNRFVRTDWYYNVLSLSSKLALFWLQVGEVEKKTLGGYWPDVQIYGLGIVLPFAFLVVGWCLAPPYPVSDPDPPTPGFSAVRALRRAISFRVASPQTPQIITVTKVVRAPRLPGRPL